MRHLPVKGERKDYEQFIAVPSNAGKFNEWLLHFRFCQRRLFDQHKRRNWSGHFSYTSYSLTTSVLGRLDWLGAKPLSLFSNLCYNSNQSSRLIYFVFQSLLVGLNQKCWMVGKASSCTGHQMNIPVESSPLEIHLIIVYFLQRKKRKYKKKKRR